MLQEAAYLATLDIELVVLAVVVEDMENSDQRKTRLASRNPVDADEALSLEGRG